MKKNNINICIILFNLFDLKNNNFIENLKNGL